jgi:hypothetical protein
MSSPRGLLFILNPRTLAPDTSHSLCRLSLNLYRCPIESLIYLSSSLFVLSHQLAHAIRTLARLYLPPPHWLTTFLRHSPVVSPCETHVLCPHHLHCSSFMLFHPTSVVAPIDTYFMSLPRSHSIPTPTSPHLRYAPCPGAGALALSLLAAHAPQPLPCVLRPRAQ